MAKYFSKANHRIHNSTLEYNSCVKKKNCLTFHLQCNPEEKINYTQKIEIRRALFRYQKLGFAFQNIFWTITRMLSWKGRLTENCKKPTNFSEPFLLLPGRKRKKDFWKSIYLKKLTHFFDLLKKKSKNH